jgi:DNA-binding beta-propeller fold protein YncE
VRSRLWLIVCLLAGLTQFTLGHYVEATLPVGSDPSALCFDPHYCKVYCASEATMTMTVIDGATNQILRTIPIGNGPRALCYNSQNYKVYCACFNSYEVDVIDCSTDSCTPLDLGLYQSANAICYNSVSNKVYCATVGGPCVFVIDGETNEFLAYFYVGDYPSGFGFNPVDNKVYCGSNSNVTVIDGVADTVVGTIPFGRAQWWSGHCSIGDKMYCGNRNGGIVAVIDGATDSILDTITTGALIYGLHYNETRNVVYVDVMDTNAVKLIDAAGDSLLPTQVPAGDWPWALLYAPETDELYCADNKGNTVAVIDGSADTLKHLIGVGKKPQALAWNPAYRRLYVANYDNATVSIIRDTLLGLAETRPEVGKGLPLAAVAGSTLLLRGSNSAALIDVSGRVAAGLKPGCNDVGRLRRGVYFVLSPSTKQICKVTVLN